MGGIGEVSRERCGGERAAATKVLRSGVRLSSRARFPSSGREKNPFDKKTHPAPWPARHSAHGRPRTSSRPPTRPIQNFRPSRPFQRAPSRRLQALSRRLMCVRLPRISRKSHSHPISPSPSTSLLLKRSITRLACWRSVSRSFACVDATDTTESSGFSRSLSSSFRSI